MTRAAYLVFILCFSSSLGCGKKSDSRNPETANHPQLKKSEWQTEKKRQVYQKYLSITQGQPPVTDPYQKRSQLNLFEDSLLRLREFQIANSKNCSRFVEILNSVGSRIVEIYTDLLLKPTSKLADYREYRIKASAYDVVLNSLFQLATNANEGGFQTNQKMTCFLREREEWKGVFAQLVEESGKLQTLFFGEPSMAEEESEFNGLHSYEQRRIAKDSALRVTFATAEVVSAILGWHKLVRPLLGFLGSFLPGPVSKLIMNVAVGTGFTSALFYGDRYLRSHLKFLKPLPTFSLVKNQSEWDQVMSFAEEQVVSSVLTPPVYFGFAELLRIAKREKNLQFITENRRDLLEAEAQHGRVEETLRELEDISSF
jgi:hypothetical protein